MRIFQLIKTVLDDIYQQIDDVTEVDNVWSSNKDEAVKLALEYLKKRYANLLHDSRSVDYTKPEIRFAYIYKYVTCHANLVYSLIEEHRHLRMLFNSSDIVATCVGGGPGSDFLGLLKYMMMREMTPRVQCTMLDREPIWGLSWHHIGRRMGTVLPFQTSFQPVDVCNANLWRAYRQLFKDTNLFTLLFFMSEIYHYQVEAEPFFDCLFQSAKPGALFLYVDNNDSRFYNWFDRLRAAHNITLLVTDNVPRKLLPSIFGREDKDDLGEYLNKFESPKLTANIAYRICRKD